MNIIRTLEEMGAFLKDDHFVYSSGKHGDIYINKNDLVLHSELTGQICKLFAEKYANTAIDIVVGPAIGGIILAHWTAYHLSPLAGKEILGVFAEKGHDKTFTFTRGYDQLLQGKKVLIVDDLANSGGTARNIIKTVENLGGSVVALAVMINRNPKELNSDTICGVPFFALSVADVPAYEEADCPLCKKGMPINTRVGHGRQYLATKNK